MVLLCSLLWLDNIVLIVNDNREIEIKLVEVVCMIVSYVYFVGGIDEGSLVVISVVLNLYNGMKVCLFGDDFVLLEEVELDKVSDIDVVFSDVFDGGR